MPVGRSPADLGTLYCDANCDNLCAHHLYDATAVQPKRRLQQQQQPNTSTVSRDQYTSLYDIASNPFGSFNVMPATSAIYITASTIVQAVIKANSQSNEKWQISTLPTCGFETPEQISIKLRTYNDVGLWDVTTHRISGGAATTWVHGLGEHVT